VDTTDLGSTYSFDASANPDTLDEIALVLARYSVDGALLAVERLTGQLDYCTPVGGRASAAQALAAAPVWAKFGHSARVTVSCDLSALARAGTRAVAAPELYELWVVDGADGLADGVPATLYPVPVRITNYRTAAGATPNANAAASDEADDVLVRRFFLYDTYSGTTAAGLQVLRYASQLVLEVRAQESAPARIRPPVLSITYRERRADGFTSPSRDDYAHGDVSLSVVYSADNDTYARVVLSFFVAAVRSPVEGALSAAVLARGAMFAAHTAAGAAFWVLVAVSLYWLVFFKLQNDVFQLLPRFRPDFAAGWYSTFRTLLVLVFAAHTVRVGEVLARQCSVDVFFLDWEKRRGPLARTVADEEATAEGKVGSERRPARYAPVSVWRTLFAANEWAELAIERRVSVPLTLLVLLTIHVGGGAQWVATPVPGTTPLTPGDVNPLVQFAHNVFWFGVVVGAQLAWRWGIYERFIAENPTTRYIDLCTVAKVSLLVLDDRYHGYYVHCDAPYEFADVTMRGLTDALHDERGAVRTGRGLSGCRDPNAQSFELHLPRLWRDQFDAIYRAFHQRAALEGAGAPGMGAAGGWGAPTAAAGGAAPSTAAAVAARVKKPRLRDDRSKAQTQLSAAAAASVSAFLKGFVREDESGPNVRRVWREKTYMQRLFNVPPDMYTEEAAAGVAQGGGLGAAGIGGIVVMYVDPPPGTAIESVTFRGAEWDLVLWNILVYCLVDHFTSNHVYAALTTYLLDLVLVVVRTEWGANNVAAKTLVDDRFLS
jgi:meckelin